MVDWLVITADRFLAGRGVRGHTLVGFLRTYYGRRGVAAQSPAEWRGAEVRADTVFVGLPSSLTPEELKRLATNCRRLVLFDYLDYQELAWSPEQEATLRSLTDCYLKPWFERGWRHDRRMGMLPIRRFGRFTATLMRQRLMRRVRNQPQLTHDVAFLGRPNETRICVGDQVKKIDQRFEWISEVKRRAPELKLWGGLVQFCDESRERISRCYGRYDDLLFSDNKVRFSVYYRELRRSRVLLAPGGNVPWSYRHYECLYAGGAVVTIDYRERDMLVPLPHAGMIHVPDEAPVLPAVREALEFSRRQPELGEENFAHLERYLRFGAYSSRRPALLERFVAQL